ncbi:MAG: HD domain-containing protein [Spirochaetales bacterium]|nr:HD domain-containing protein [Spirochaetales bacterium]
MSRIGEISDFLDNHFTEPIRDPLWKHIYFPPCFQGILKSCEFLQLHGIRQLGPTYLVYPGATHSRYNHSLGVFHIAYKMVLGFIKKNRSMDFTLEGVKAFLLASLLHDLGHYPFAHSLKDIGVRDHEELTSQIILNSSLNKIIEKKCGTNAAWVAQIVDKSLPAESEEIRFFTKVLSGVLDPDKLDYLNRDAYFCGVPYGIQDLDHILNEILPLKNHGIAITPKGVISVESLLFSKYLMYKSIYWHKNVRIATAMIKKAMIESLAQGTIKADELYGLEDQGLAALADKRPTPEMALVRDVFKGRLYNQVFRAAFDSEHELHTKLEKFDSRSQWENEIFHSLKKSFTWLRKEMIIVDVPEPITFETDLMVIDEDHEYPYQKAESMFKGHGSESFVKNLRFIALYAPDNPELEAKLKGMALEILD